MKNRVRYRCIIRDHFPPLGPWEDGTDKPDHALFLTEEEAKVRQQELQAKFPKHDIDIERYVMPYGG